MKLIEFRILIGSLICVLVILTGCKKWIEVDPPVNKTTALTVYASSSTAVAVMNGVYYNMSKDDFGYRDLAITADDIMPPVPGSTDNFYINDYTNGVGRWENWYRDYIFQDNSIIEGVTASATIPESVKKVLIAEAKFNRAFIYFYLVNLWGDVPLVLTTDLKTNSNIPRTPSDQVYLQIVQDLKDAKEGLAGSYLDKTLQTVTNERIRPNKAAASALLARVYLYRKQWVQAESEASEVISNSLYRLTDPDQVFLKNSDETVWALQPGLMTTDQNVNTEEGKLFIPIGDSPPSVFGGEATSWLHDTFESGDRRKENWLLDHVDFSGTHHQVIYKYKVGDVNASGITDSREYSIQLRLAEQYLIRAEARAHQNKLTGVASAQEDIDMIRNRAGLSGTLASSQQGLLDAIMQERRVELFTEGGHRWLDLKRTGTIDAIMGNITPLKGGIWQPYKAWFPIPYGEFVNNPALRGHQNPGYKETF